MCRSLNEPRFCMRPGCKTVTHTSPRTSPCRFQTRDLSPIQMQNMANRKGIVMGSSQGSAFLTPDLDAMRKTCGEQKGMPSLTIAGTKGDRLCINHQGHAPLSNR